MTLKDILEIGYGIDFSTLNFQLLDKGEDATPVADIKQSLATDEIIMDGNFDLWFDLYGVEPNGYLEIYDQGEDLANAAEARCAQMDW